MTETTTSNVRRVRTLVIGGGVLAIALALAITPTFSSAPSASADGGALHDGMEKLNRTFRGLRRAGDDYAKILDAAVEMQEAIMMCKGETPETVEELDGKKQGAALKEYRSQMITLMQEALELERAALEENAGKVKASVQKLQGMQKKGHDQFKGKDEDEKKGRGRRG